MRYKIQKQIHINNDRHFFNIAQTFLRKNVLKAHYFELTLNNQNGGEDTGLSNDGR